MAKGKVTAWERDGSRLRYLVARLDGGSIVVERASELELDAEGSPAKALSKALTATAQRGDAIVVLSRSAGELRQFQLPPAPDDELPDMLRFQAARQFTIDEGSALDFTPLHRAEEGVEVIAAAMPGKLMKELQASADAAQMQIKQAVIRPFATAAVWLRQRPGVPAVLLSLTEDAVDLTVCDGAKVVLSRSARRPESGSLSQWLTLEVRRTRGASRSVQPETLVAFDEDLQQVAAEVASTLDMSLETCKPAALSELSTIEGPRGRFVALVGALQEYSSGVRPAIDLISPRRPPEPVDQRQRIRLYSLVGALVLIVAAGMGFLRHLQLTQKLQQLNQQRAALDRELKKTEETQVKVAAVEEYLANDVNWLAELERISKGAPDPSEVQLDLMSASIGAAPGGRISFQGLAARSNTITDLEGNLRDDRYTVTSRGATTFLPEQNKWKFTANLAIAPEPRPDLETLVSAAASNVDEQDSQGESPPAAEGTAPDAPTGEQSPQEVQPPDNASAVTEANETPRPAGEGESQADAADEEPMDNTPAADDVPPQPSQEARS